MYDDDEELIKRVQRIASALRATSDKLDMYYASLSEKGLSPSGLQLGFPRPTLAPSETSVPIWKGLQPALEGFKPFSRLEFKGYLQHGNEGTLKWIDAEESTSTKMDLMCGLYVAEAFRKNKRSLDVVVKFVQAYGIEAHKLLAKEGCAPKLYGCRSVIGGWTMVVMERVKGKQWNHLTKEDVNASTFIDLEQSIKALHEKGIFHGDLRACNVMVDADGRAKVIDFDWAVKGGFYPSDINMDLVTEKKELHKDVKALGPIEEAHDLYALSVLRKMMPEPSTTDSDSAVDVGLSSPAASITFSSPGPASSFAADE